MSEEAQTMVKNIIDNQAKACVALSEVLAAAGGKLGSQDLEALAQSVALMAAARRNLEIMANAVSQQSNTTDKVEGE